MSFREVTIGPCRLICADCMDVLPTLTGVDAVVTDPPYGIGASTKEFCNPRKRGAARCPSKHYEESEWDSKPCDPQALAYMRQLSQWQIIFGGNYFNLPPSRCWLVWDKLNGDNGYADCELAWTNLDKAVRRIQFQWHGMLRDEAGERVHPTQKPVGVMSWCIGHLPTDAETILDPFMGSGTTGVACIQTDRRFIGIEKEEKYFDIACNRIQRAWDLKCSELPFEKPPKERQLDLLMGADQ